MVRAAGPVLLAFCLLLIGCSAHGNASGAAASASSLPSAAAAPATSPPASSSAAPASPALSTPSTASPSAAPKAPTLGLSRSRTQGYGTVRPSTIDNGGDPTGIVTDVSWSSWGGSRAIATGMGYYDPPNVPVAMSTREKATVVAFNLGTCSGRYMYQAIEWYFPESGGSFDPTSYWDICSWAYHQGNGP